MKKKIVLLLTGVAVCSVLMMGCQSNAGGDASDDVQTEDVNPADEVTEPETEPIPEETTEPDETAPETEGAPEATTAPGEEGADTEVPEGEASGAEASTAPEGTEADSEDSEGGETESAPEGEEKKAE